MFDKLIESPMAIYRRHLDNGVLAYQYSLAANAAFFPARVVCPFTGTDRFEWRVSAGVGTVYAVTVVHAKDARHNVVLVDVDEGFRMLSRVECIAPEAVTIGMRVRVRVRMPDGGNSVDAPYPVFDPVDAT